MARSSLVSLVVAAVACTALLVPVGCGSAAGGGTESEELTGAPETAGHAALTASIPVGSTLQSTTGVNLRTGPGTSYSVLHVVPSGAKVTVEQAAPSNGFYKVKHNGTVGWSYGSYYKLVDSGGGTGGTSGAAGSGGNNPPDPPPSGGARDNAIARAKQGVGFSYWWGHGRWRAEGPTASTQGSCSGSCPSCSHSGSYGADCSGYVGKIWEVPASNSDVTVDSHPYSTGSFVNDTSQWSTVSRGSLVQADALVYNSGSAGHIMLYSSGDGWGSVYAYECKGCSAGCVYDLRSVGSAYHGIRRSGW